MSNKKLPKAVAIMVEKNNLVMAIKTLAEEENISMTEAKERIDVYEAALKAKREQQVQRIANKQAKRKPVPLTTPTTQSNTRTSAIQSNSAAADKDNDNKGDFTGLHSGLDQHLQDIGYKKPLVPRWVWRVLVIIVVMVIVGFAIWRLFIS